jgi:hypothetical protein
VADTDAELWRQKAEMWRALAQTAPDQHTADSFLILATEAEEEAAVLARESNVNCTLPRTRDRLDGGRMSSTPWGAALTDRRGIERTRPRGNEGWSGQRWCIHFSRSTPAVRVSP